jgi:hypothetical protein
MLLSFVVDVKGFLNELFSGQTIKTNYYHQIRLAG